MIQRLANRFRSDSGYALPTVIVLSLVMLVLVTGSISVTLSGLRKANSDQDSSAALAAAYAGVAEYQSRLSNDSTYFKFGNPNATFTKTPASIVSLPVSPNVNPAFDISSGGTWAPVPGSDNRATFRYEVNTSQYGISGIIKLRVTGRVDGSTASIVADLRQKGFLDFLYFTEYETSDPLTSPTKDTSTTPAGLVNCVVYDWPTDRDSRCPVIQFGALDVIKGPVHSNDRLVICSSTFEGAVTSASTRSYKDVCAKDPVFKKSIGVEYRDGITIPPTNGQLRTEGRNDLATEVPRPGCLYTGPTSITLTSDGKMNVISPWTKFTNVSFTSGIPSANPAQCGTTAALGSAAGATIDVLDQNLIFVQNVPADKNDPNSWTTGPAAPSDFLCTQSGGVGGWTNFGVGYPRTGESTPNLSTTSTPAYGCKNGDVFVVGTLKGQMTIAAENYIYVTGDVKYANTQSSILGLIGQNAVWVYNPMESDKTTPLLKDSGRTIQAAVLSVAHTITVQNFQQGSSRGTLSILGAFAQKFRGIVSQGGGYVKAYVYDERLKFTAPPKFLTPVTTTYGITQYANVAAAYKPDGTPIP